MFPSTAIDLPPWRDDEFDDERAPERNRVLYQMLGVRRDPIEDLYGVMASYFGMVRFIDDALGQILDKLDELGLREQTIVVFCSDHGDFMGEHAMQCKGGGLLRQPDASTADRLLARADRHRSARPEHGQSNRRGADAVALASG